MKQLLDRLGPAPEVRLYDRVRTTRTTLQEVPECGWDPVDEWQGQGLWPGLAWAMRTDSQNAVNQNSTCQFAASQLPRQLVYQTPGSAQRTTRLGWISIMQQTLLVL